KGSHREQPQCDRNQARPPDRGYAPPKITDDRIRYAPERDRSFSQNKRTERTTAGKQIETMVRGGCQSDGKDSFDFVCSRGSNRRRLVLSGNMTRQRDCDLRVNEYAASSLLPSALSECGHVPDSSLNIRNKEPIRHPLLKVVEH